MKEYNVREFTKSELNKYLAKLGVNAEISLGLLAEYGFKLEVEDPFFDDAYEICVKDRKGYIAGANERSILFGVYRLLTEWGITFVRPGKDGTVFPKVCYTKDINISEKAYKRHRVMCIEGAISIENALDMIDWLPKMGFNSYYIQFSVPHIFFDRWYSHIGNPYKEPEPYDEDKSVEYHERMVQEIKKRGLILHAIGHGWTCVPFGVSDKGWYKHESFPQEYVDICALVKGKRQVWQNTPLKTQVCYSNPYVRKTIVKAVLDYIRSHPESDIVHFWGGDWMNNTCECPGCIKDRLSDHYMRIANDITDVLAKENLKTKLGLLLFYNANHPPVVEEIRNPENTVLLFAPIWRDFYTPFPSEYTVKEISEYKINAFYSRECLPVEKNLAFLYAWKQKYDGDCLDFDYHLMWDHILDAGGEGIAKLLSQDLKNLSPLGMNGFVSCQLQRNAFPSSLGMTVMAKTLWNSDADFDKIRYDLYAASFGADSAELMCDYFSALSDAFDVGTIQNQRQVDREVFRQKIENARSLMESFGNEIEKHRDLADACQRKSWEYLEYHRNAYILMANQILALLSKNKPLAEKYREEAVNYIMKNEDDVQGVVDTMFFARILNERVTVVKEAEFVGN